MTRNDLKERIDGIGDNSSLIMSWIDAFVKEEAISFHMKVLGLPASARESVNRHYNKFVEEKGKGNKSE